MLILSEINTCITFEEYVDLFIKLGFTVPLFVNRSKVVDGLSNDFIGNIIKRL